MDEGPSGSFFDEPHPEEAAESPRGDRASYDAPRRRKQGAGCGPLFLAAVLVFALLGGAAYLVKGRIQSVISPAPDYSGSGTGRVIFQVGQGDTSAEIGRNLKAKGVVASVDAFTKTANSDPKAQDVQVGYYEMHHKMSSQSALNVLTDPKNLMQSLVRVPEGARVKDVIAAIVKHTDIPEADVKSALADPGQLGLPPDAQGNPEGYLFPATYTVPPKTTASELLKQMVDKTKQVQTQLDITQKAAALGYSVHQVMTLASVLQYEGQRAEDLPKIARVFYNRLHANMPLQSDATVAYANNLSGTVWTTQSQRDNPSAYNTYVHPGLPPGPIGSPSEATLKATLEPAQGDWKFFVPVNLRTGETRFAATYAEHQRNVAQLRAWCARTHSSNCG